jgi:hypothetical protein
MAQRGLEPLTLPDGPAGGPAPSWLEVIQSLIFWLVIAAIAWYLLKTYLSENPGVLRELQQIRGIGAFFRLLARLWRQLWSLTQAGWDMIPKRVRFGDEHEGQAGRFGFRRRAGLGSLSPRERILYYYLNIIERTKKPGPARAPHQTPYEYESDLRGAVPEAEQDVNILTRAFVHARYSQETFDDTQAALARALWQRIRQALTTRRQKGEAEEPDSSFQDSDRQQ